MKRSSRYTSLHQNARHQLINARIFVQQSEVRLAAAKAQLGMAEEFAHSASGRFVPVAQRELADMQVLVRRMEMRLHAAKLNLWMAEEWAAAHR